MTDNITLSATPGKSSFETPGKSFFDTLGELQDKFIEDRGFDTFNETKYPIKFTQEFLDNLVENRFEPKGSDSSRIEKTMNYTIEFILKFDKEISKLSLNNETFIRNLLGNQPIHIRREKVVTTGDTIVPKYMINDFIQGIEQILKRLYLFQTNKKDLIARIDKEIFDKCLEEMNSIKVEITHINNDILNRMKEARKAWNEKNLNNKESDKTPSPSFKTKRTFDMKKNDDIKRNNKYIPRNVSTNSNANAKKFNNVDKINYNNRNTGYERKSNNRADEAIELALKALNMARDGVKC